MSTEVEEIKARLNIVDVVGGYVRLTKSGTHWKACCPFHNEKSPSFMVNEERQIWHCFGCGKGGDIFSFLMEMETLDFREALKVLADRAGVELPRYGHPDGGSVMNEEKSDGKSRLFELLELATKFYEKQLWEGEGKKSSLPYLLDRGLTEESIRTFRLGYAPNGWRHIFEFLLDRGYSADELERVGLIIRKTSGDSSFEKASLNLGGSFYDRFRDRIQFPITDPLGRVVGYSARVAPGGDESQAKYINTPETVVYHKSRVLYGLSYAKQAIKQAKHTIIVEGNMDVIAMYQAGFANTVAVSGTALTDDQLTLLKRYAPAVRLFFDMDGAGQAASWKSTNLALEKEMNTSIVTIPSGKDAAELAKNDVEALRAAVAAPVAAPEYFLKKFSGENDRSTAEGKRVIAERFAELIASMRNVLERSHWVTRLADELRMDEKVLSQALVGVLSRFSEGRPRVVFGGDDAVVRKRVELPRFGRRSETLREELVAFSLSSAAAREVATAREIDADVKEFLSGHPLFFFLVQAGAKGDALALMEDRVLKSEATKLTFRVLERPDVVVLPTEEREERLRVLAVQTRDEIVKELHGREKLATLKEAIDVAKRHGDRDEERRLLTEFSRLSIEKREP